MADLDLSPHPLVVGLATALKKAQPKGAQRRKAARNAALHAQQVGAPDTAQSGGSSGSELSEGQISNVAHLAVNPNIPELVAFGGYLGGTTTAPPGEATWQILYLDAKLLTWVLVQ